MTLEDEYFPRGGKTKAKDNEKVRGFVKKTSESLFKNPAINKKKKRLKKKKFEEKDLSIELDNTKVKKNTEKQKNAQRSIEPLSQAVLVDGMVVLCRILEIREMNLLVSLPGRISATVPITNISTPYSELLHRLADGEDIEVKSLNELFTIGQLFPCGIKEVADSSSYKVLASLNPADVNKNIPVTALSKGLMLAAAVQSIEDHGYVMDVGLPGVRCFIPKKSSEDGQDEQQLALGQVVQGNVVQCQIDGTTATLTLSLDREVKFKQNVELNVSTLIPGTRVHINVTKVTPQGLLVAFGNLIGHVHKDHLADQSDKLSSYSNQSKQQAVVLYTLPLVNAIYLSLKSSILSPETSKTSRSYRIGRTFDAATITDSSGVGLFVKLDAEGTRGYIPLRHVSDNSNEVEEIKSLHPPKAKRKCRVLQYASMDEIYVCTMKKSLLSQKALRYEDFTVGQLVEGKIDSVSSSGVTVILGHNLKGFVPKLHWADDPRLRKPELKFKIGAPLKCRVLRLQSDRRQLHLTCKPTLVNDTEAPACSEISQLHQDLRIKGTVSLIQNGGVLVSFYGELTGWIPKVKLERKGIADMGRYFFLGQIIDCIVKNIQDDSGKVTLDLDKGAGDVSERRNKTDHQLGSIVQCRVVKIHLESEGNSSAGIEVSLTESNASCWIPVNHLSDFPPLCPVWLHHYRPGDLIPEAMLCSVSEVQIIASIKPSLIEFAKAGNFPRSLAEIQVNSVYPCLFNSQRDFGILAKLFCPPRPVRVMFPKSKCPESLRLAVDEMANDQSLSPMIEGRVLSVDAEHRKVALSALTEDIKYHSADVLTFYLKEVDRIRQRYAESTDPALQYLTNLKRGDTVVGKLSQQFDEGADLEFDLPNGIKAVVPVFHHAKQAFKINDVIAGCVVHVDIVKRVVYVTTRDNIVEELTPEPETGEPAAREEGRDVTGKVILNTEYMSLVLTPESVVYAPNVRNWNDVLRPPGAPYSVGTNVKLEGVGEAVVADCPVVPYFRYSDRKKSKAGQKRQRKSSEASVQSTKPQTAQKKRKTTLDSDATTEPVKAAKSQRAIATQAAELPRLQISAGFNWDEDQNTTKLSTLAPAGQSSDSDDESEDSADESVAEPGKLTAQERRERARQKLEKMRQEEKALSAVELSLTDGDRAPVTADDFDRLLLSSPNSSILWLQYMAFHLENADVDKARAVAQKALKSISFREEQEKFNVWIAWLNLEHMYGTTEAYDETFQEALRCNDPLKIHRQMALNFEQNGQFEPAENLYNVMLKKYGKENPSVWLAACTFYVKQSKLDTARNVFQKALTSLPKKDHIDLISRFGQLEVKFGELERGKTMFDTLLMSYPKRTDLWLVYVDTLTKAGHLDSARQVLERSITLQLPAKKMKTLFQRFLDFETAHGDPERLDYVRRKALEYVESKSGPTDE